MSAQSLRVLLDLTVEAHRREGKELPPDIVKATAILPMMEKAYEDGDQEKYLWLLGKLMEEPKGVFTA
ncbi:MULTISPECIES: hypothetical protein [unclassified Pseudomonas]|uniref:hypothetical protein n=1 Tax=unclassified Pseudomonas TaxID=196821 RepID=UPI00235FEE8F|nr:MULTISPECIES: hypothetical protein [unclassified Pseudomonas]